MVVGSWFLTVNRLDGSLLCSGGGMGGQVLSAGGDHISGLQGDDGAVGVGNQAGVGHGTSGGEVVQTVGGKVLSLGGGDSGLIDRDDGAVGVGHQTAVAVGVGVSTVGGIGVSTAIGVGPGVGTSVGVGISTGVGQAVGGQVGGAGSGHGGLVSGHNGAVGVGDQLGRGDSHAGSENLRKSTVRNTTT